MERSNTPQRSGLWRRALGDVPGYAHAIYAHAIWVCSGCGATSQERRTATYINNHQSDFTEERGRTGMQAIAVFPNAREVKLIEIPSPEISQPSEVKVRVLEVGICGTDREICAFHYGTPPDGAEYLILGHEALGQVVAVGSAVRDLTPGDLVVPTVRRPCRHPECEPCRANRSDFCDTGDFSERGIKG